MSESIPHVNLNELVEPIATVAIGTPPKTYDVLPVHGDARIIFEQIAEEKRAGKTPTGDQSIERAQQIVAAVCPKMPQAVIRGMAYQQLLAVAQLSMGAEVKVRKVMETATGKGSGPAKGQRTRSGRK